MRKGEKIKDKERKGKKKDAKTGSRRAKVKIKKRKEKKKEELKGKRR